MKPRQVGQYISDIQELSRVVETIGQFRKGNLQAFLETRLSELAPATISRKFSTYRAYWKYLEAHDLVSADIKPFDGVLLPPKRATVQRRQWTPAQVCELWHGAMEREQLALAHAIRLAAYTGGRIEAICSLTSQQIRTDPEGRLYIHFRDKTQAGKRDVPVHPQLRGLVECLVNEAGSREGFLLSLATSNKHAERSVGIGKQFGRLRTELGYGEELVFHSIRRTVVGLLSESGCPEHVAADILGHKKPTITYGLYGSAAALRIKAEWMEKALNYPDATFVRGC